MQPSIKPTRLLERHAIENKVELDMGILAILQRCTSELSFTDEN
jgi:hypothetical protein